MGVYACQRSPQPCRRRSSDRLRIWVGREFSSDIRTFAIDQSRACAERRFRRLFKGPLRHGAAISTENGGSEPVARHTDKGVKKSSTLKRVPVLKDLDTYETLHRASAAICGGQNQQASWCGRLLRCWSSLASGGDHSWVRQTKAHAWHESAAIPMRTVPADCGPPRLRGRSRPPSAPGHFTRWCNSRLLHFLAPRCCHGFGGTLLYTGRVLASWPSMSPTRSQTIGAGSPGAPYRTNETDQQQESTCRRTL